MSSSHFAAVHIVPLISRVVLCAAFLPMGYSKLFDRAPIEPAQLARLEAMGWGWKPPVVEVVVPETPPSDTAPNAASADTPVAAPSDSSAATEASPPTVRRCEMLAFTIAEAGLPAPRVTAWLVAIIEFVGGALILIGLFSRLSALGLAAVMVGAIYTTSLAAHQAHPFIYGMPLPDYQRLFLQVGLLALAIGVLFSGPGGMSLDRVLFGRSVKHRAAPRGGTGGA